MMNVKETTRELRSSRAVDRSAGRRTAQVANIDKLLATYAGGYHATANPQESLKELLIDLKRWAVDRGVNFRKALDVAESQGAHYFEVKSPENSNVNGNRMDRFASGKALDRISDHLEGLGKEIPREASNLRGMALRLDRMANTLEAEQEATERVSRIENELDDLGVDFTVAPNSSGKTATYIYAYKGQLNSRGEASVLGRIAKKHGSTLENGSRAYKITVPHYE